MTQPNSSSSLYGSQTERTVFELSGVTRAVEKMLDERAGGKQFWVRAEISQCSFSGRHAYLELVEEENGQRKAQVRATIWSAVLVRIRKELGEEFDEVLKPGREIVFRAQMSFHAVHGFSLNIQSIDLDVLLGEMERRRKATLLALQKEGAVGRNALCALNVVPRRLVLIGSVGTAGHTDFLAHLRTNPWGYQWDIGCIDALVQGDRAPEALIAALHKAGRVAMKCPLDAVVLLRGGGAKLDLDVFNDLSLCRTIAAMDVPVITGIGHETDRTLADEVAHASHKTPTAVADFLLDRFANCEAEVEREGRAIAAASRGQLALEHGALKSCRTSLLDRPKTLFGQQRARLHQGAHAVVHRTRSAMSSKAAQVGEIRASLLVAAQSMSENGKSNLSELEQGIMREASRQLKQQQERVTAMRAALELLGPEPTLRRGFSITRFEGKAIRDVGALEVGMNITTELESGTFTAEVKKVHPLKPKS